MNTTFFKTKISALLFFSLILFANDGYSESIENWYKNKNEECLKKVLPGRKLGDSTYSDSQPDDRGRTACAAIAIRDLQAKRRACSKEDTNCKTRIDEMMADLRSVYGVPESKEEEYREKRCDNLYSEDSEIFKECAKVNAKSARACAKFGEEQESGVGGFMGGETMQMAGPLLGMVNGADAVLGIYSAMNDRPECYLSKEEFQAKEDKLDQQKKDLEEKIQKAMTDAEEAQTEFTEQLAKWSEEEGELADKLAAIPGESEDAKYKLSSEKVKIKMQVDSKYNAITAKMGELRRKYNDLVSAKAVALAKSSQFAIHDECSIVATGGDPNKQSATNPKPPAAVQSSFSGAFAQGRALAVNIQKRYDNCMNIKAKEISRLESTFTSELAAIKAELQGAEASLGQVAEEKRMADEEIIREIGKVDSRASAKVKEIQGKYQRIQTDKANKQSALKTKLERLATETKKNQQNLAILQMKLRHYAGKSPAKNTDGKSMGDMLTQCGESYRVLLEGFKTTCCKDEYNYNGAGSSACRYKATDFSKPAERPAKPAKADPKESTPAKKEGK